MTRTAKRNAVELSTILAGLFVLAFVWRIFGTDDPGQPVVKVSRSGSIRVPDVS